MTVPIATYRLQFRNGMTFDTAIGLIPYWTALGISHLYASPVFAATNGSTHGYDVTDPNAFDTVLGGRAGFDRLSAALRQAGIGLVLDIVPNHMAASLENHWWRSAVVWGPQSPFAHYYDIDWSRPLTLPELGKTFAEAVSEKEILLRLDPTVGELAFGYYESNTPLHPSSYAAALDGIPGQLAAGIAAAAAAATPSSEEAFRQTVRALIEDAEEGERTALDAALSALSAETITAIHERQAYRLVHWTKAASDLSYRRFFEVAGLAGLRVEDPDVFAATHQLVLELVRDGTIDGLRIDHVDGLADPKAYLQDLRDAVGPDVYLVIEKIIEDEEKVAPDWPVAGTTGYEFIAALTHLFVEASRTDDLDAAYRAFAEADQDYSDILTDAKQLMLDVNFAGEVKRLVALGGMAAGVAADGLAEALKALIVAFPVYRTYGTTGRLEESDRAILTGAADRAVGRIDAPARPALDAIVAVLTEPSDAAGLEFRRRFQQLTGPVMAKAMEDTAFYRYNRLLAVNEVGGNPAESHLSVANFHAAMARRAAEQPHGITTTSTHDTKRGEDARARLYTISEAPEVWATAVKRWHRMNAGLVRSLKDGPAPEPAVEWALYQALAGVWPEELSPADEAGLSALAERFSAYVEKMLREAKLRTNWSGADETYEEAVQAFASHLLSSDNRAFIDDFRATLAPFRAAGLINSLTQTLVKMTAPGVPDVYQGSERDDSSLVDPDNRRMPDYDAMAKLLSMADNVRLNEAPPASGHAKLTLTARLIAVRNAMPALFGEGDYIPLDISGPSAGRLVAYARKTNDQAAIVVAPCRVLPLMEKSEDWAKAFHDIRVTLPDSLAGRRFRDALEGEAVIETGKHLVLEQVPSAPFVLLVTE